MPYIHKKELKSMPDDLIVNGMATADQPHQFRKEARDRMAVAKKGFWFNVQHATNNVSTKKASVSNGLKCWRTDKALKDDPDFKSAIEELREYSEEYWPLVEDPQKTLEEVQSFLESILDQDHEYSTLTPKMVGLLGVIRRAHLEWVDGNN